MNIFSWLKKKWDRDRYDEGVCWAQMQLKMGVPPQEVLSIIEMGKTFHRTPFDWGAEVLARANLK